MASTVLPARIAPGRPAVRRSPGTLSGRCAGAAAACLSAASLGAHVLMLAVGGHGAVAGIGLAAMALACAGCAGHAVVRPSCRGSVALVGMSIGMALVHAAMALGLPGGQGMHAMHDGGAPLTSAGTGAGHGGLMLAVVGLELAVAWLAAFAVHRARVVVRFRGRMRA